MRYPHAALAALLLSSSVLAQDFQPGQIWSYKTRPNEQASTLTILKVEHYPDMGDVLHVRVDGFQMPNARAQGSYSAMPHMPFARSAIEASITSLKGKGPVPDFTQGYEFWKAGYIAGNAGVFTTPVDQALNQLWRANWAQADASESSE